MTAIAASLCIAVVVARIALALATPAPELVFDAAGYDQAARRWVDSGYFAYVHPEVEVASPARNAQVMPGYPLFLATIYAATGTQTPQPTVSIAQALLSGLMMWGIFLLAKRSATPLTGLTAVILSAAYLPFWWSYRFALTEDLFCALCVWTAVAIQSGLKAQGRGALLPYTAVGALGAAAVYVRATAGAWLFLTAALLLLLGGANPVRHLRGVAVAALVAIACFAPWWIRNAGIYGTFVPLATMTASGSLVSTYDDKAQLTRALEPLEVDYLHPRDELVADDAIARLARQRNREAWTENPSAVVWKRARAAAISLLTYHPNPFGGFAGWGAVTELIHLALLTLGAMGAWLTRRQPITWVLVALPLSLVLVHTATLMFSRYLFPMMPFVIVLAAVAVTWRAAGPVATEAA